MATSRQIRVLSLQALFALDMADGRDPEAIRAAVEAGHSFEAEDPSPRAGSSGPTPKAATNVPATQPTTPTKPVPAHAEFTPAERRRAFEAAVAAWDSRDEADEFFLTLAPTWPASRQPVIDRSILRLSWHEMRGGKTPPRIVVSEAIDMARDFSTEKSPAFINGLLDKALKRFEGQGFDAGDTDDDGFDDAETGSAGGDADAAGQGGASGGNEPDDQSVGPRA